MSLLINAQNLSKRFAAEPLFHNLDVSIHERDKIALVGGNGVGKSTLLRIMAKIFAPYSGEVLWAPGVTVSLLTLGLGFRPDLTGRENALLACLLQGLTKHDANSVLDDIQAFCEIGDFFDAPVRAYSTGMRARLGFATALANRSDVILIDETLAVGDTVFKEKAQKSLKGQMTEERGIVIVSHAPAQITLLCGRAIWLDEGGVALDGTPDDVLASYNK